MEKLQLPIHYPLSFTPFLSRSFFLALIPAFSQFYCSKIRLLMQTKKTEGKLYFQPLFIPENEQPVNNSC